MTRGKIRGNKIFVHDYMGGWLDRGIPLYTRNLIKTLRACNFSVVTISASGLQRKWPRCVNHVLGAITEQLVSPIMWRLRGADMAVYPYNSMPLLDISSRRTLIVIHDVMAFKFNTKQYTRFYYSLIYYFLKKARKPIYTVSLLEVERLKEFGFADNQIGVLPNSFAGFCESQELLVSKYGDTGGDRNNNLKVLLCSGRGRQKNLPWVWRYLMPLAIEKFKSIEVLGLAGYRSQDREWLGIDCVEQKVRILPGLSDVQVAETYYFSDIVWLHSLEEGFGRCLVEGRFAGKRIVCNDIPEFRVLADDFVFFYKDENDFIDAVDRALASPKPALYEKYGYTEMILDVLDSLKKQ